MSGKPTVAADELAGAAAQLKKATTVVKQVLPTTEDIAASTKIGAAAE